MTYREIQKKRRRKTTRRQRKIINAKRRAKGFFVAKDGITIYILKHDGWKKLDVDLNYVPFKK